MGIVLIKQFWKRKLTSKIVYLSRENLFTLFYFVILLFWRFYVFVSLSSSKGLLCLIMLRRQKSTDLESISWSLECKGDIQNSGWEPNISSWTIFDAFTEVTRQAILPFKNPRVSRIWIHICAQWEVQLIPIPQSFTWLPNQKSHPDEAPYPISRSFPDNMCLLCFSKLLSVGPRVTIILSLQINRIIALTFQTKLLSWE